MRVIVLLLHALILILSVIAIVLPRPQGATPTWTDGLHISTEPHYYLAGYTTSTFGDGARDLTLYNSSIALYSFALPDPIGTTFVEDPMIRVDAVAAGPQIASGRKIFFAGVRFHRNRSESLFVGVVAATLHGSVIAANYSAPPARKVHITSLSSAGKHTLICGRLVNDDPSSAFAYQFNENLVLERSLVSRNNGTKQDMCSSATRGSGDTFVISVVRYSADKSSLSSFYTFAIDSEFDLWSLALTKDVLSSLSVSDVVPMGMSVDRGSLYILATARSGQDKAALVFFKLGEKSGTLLYSRTLPMEGDLTYVLGPIVTYDNYLYSLVRERESIKFTSKQLRISMWGAHVSADDVVTRLWSSSSRKGPAVALTFNKLDGGVKALGASRTVNDTTNGTMTYTDMPLNPSTNDAKRAAIPLGSTGEHFLRITFELMVNGAGQRELLAASEILAHSLRVLPVQLVFEKDAKKLETRSSGAKERFALTVQGDDLEKLEKKLLSDVERVAQTKQADGRSLIEKSAGMGAGVITLSKLRVVSRGNARENDKDKPGRTAGDVAEDVVVKTTITAVCLAGGLVLIVIFAILYNRLRNAMKPPGSEQSNSDGTADGDVSGTFLTLRRDGSLAVTSSFGGEHVLRQGTPKSDVVAMGNEGVLPE